MGISVGAEEAAMALQDSPPVRPLPRLLLRVVEPVDVVLLLGQLNSTQTASTTPKERKEEKKKITRINGMRVEEEEKE